MKVIKKVKFNMNVAKYHINEIDIEVKKDRVLYIGKHITRTVTRKIFKREITNIMMGKGLSELPDSTLEIINSSLIKSIVLKEENRVPFDDNSIKQ